MISQTKSIMIKQSELVSAVEKLTPAAGDVFLFLIKSLKNCISTIDEATDQALDIESGIFEDAVVIDMKDAMGQLG